MVHHVVRRRFSGSVVLPPLSRRHSSQDHPYDARRSAVHGLPLDRLEVLYSRALAIHDEHRSVTFKHIHLCSCCLLFVERWDVYSVDCFCLIRLNWPHGSQSMRGHRVEGCCCLKGWSVLLWMIYLVVWWGLSFSLLRRKLIIFLWWGVVMLWPVGLAGKRWMGWSLCFILTAVTRHVLIKVFISSFLLLSINLINPFGSHCYSILQWIFEASGAFKPLNCADSHTKHFCC